VLIESDLLEAAHEPRVVDIDSSAFLRVSLIILFLQHGGRSDLELNSSM